MVQFIWRVPDPGPFLCTYMHMYALEHVSIFVLERLRLVCQTVRHFTMSEYIKLC